MCINLYLYQNPRPKHILNYIGKEKLIIEEIISENPEMSTDRMELTVATSRLIQVDAIIPVEGLVLLTVSGNQEFKYEDFIRFKTRLKVPHNFQNPGGFDYVRHLRYNGAWIYQGFLWDCRLERKSGGYVQNTT